MKHRRPVLIILSCIVILLFGGMAIKWLNDKCPYLSINECRLMWGTAIASTVGGILLAEVLVAHRKAEGKWRFRPPRPQSHTSESESDKSDSLNWYIWIRPVAWVTLSSLLAALPLIIAGAFVVTFSGTITGMFINGLVRAITNTMAPVEESEES